MTDLPAGLRVGYRHRFEVDGRLGDIWEGKFTVVLDDEQPVELPVAFTKATEIPEPLKAGQEIKPYQLIELPDKSTILDHRGVYWTLYGSTWFPADASLPTPMKNMAALKLPVTIVRIGFEQ
jgi:hypothetical protein